jgi:hypothetical protein
MTMEYETIVSEYVDYGRNKFLEISKKKVKPDETIFLNISKGFYTPEGEKRYQRGIGFPNEQDIVNNLIAKLQSVATVDVPESVAPAEVSEEEAAGEEEV